MAQKRKGIIKPRHKPFLKEYNFEIKVILLLGLGIFLLVEDLEIKNYIFFFIRKLFITTGDSILWIRNSMIFLIDKVEPSDLVGISLIVYVLFLIANRWRERMIERFSQLIKCPKCGGSLHRIKRELNHKFLSILYFVNIKHYHCKSCNYKGMKLLKK